MTPRVERYRPPDRARIQRAAREVEAVRRSVHAACAMLADEMARVFTPGARTREAVVVIGGVGFGLRE